MKIDKCRSCQADIIWTVTEKGKSMPVDAKPAQGFVLSETQWGVEALGGKMHLSHFATCPNADQHRKS